MEGAISIATSTPNDVTLRVEEDVSDCAAQSVVQGASKDGKKEIRRSLATDLEASVSSKAVASGGGYALM